MEDKSTKTITTDKITPTYKYNAVFLIFAEFLGYDSPVIEWAENYCKTGVIEDFKKKVIEVDAVNIFKKMQNEFTLDEIRSWWNTYYDVILKGFNDKIKDVEEIPF